ncbi:hypothetical protein TA3x_000391 [Tundrisphaera sp. TA3]|uniref:hypothetical protein n=1 Tax=Tundrisphaera sp. TA3 TaxID=3435775 RepID=UPI003EBCE5A4
MSRRMGQIHACPCFLEAVDRGAMVTAIREHARQIESGSLRSDHSHAGTRFHIETQADRAKSVIRLSPEA